MHVLMRVDWYVIIIPLTLSGRIYRPVLIKTMGRNLTTVSRVIHNKLLVAIPLTAKRYALSGACGWRFRQKHCAHNSCYRSHRGIVAQSLCG